MKILGYNQPWTNNWFLGFEIRRDREAKTILINQRTYIESMVEKFRLTNAKSVSTPMDPNSQFSLKQCPSTIDQVAKMRGVPYSEAVRVSPVALQFGSEMDPC